MRKYNWFFGVVLSLGLSLIHLSIRIMRESEFTYGVVVHGILYNFLFGLSCWYMHQVLLRQQPKIKLLFAQYLFSVLSISFVGASILIFDHVFEFFNDGLLQLPESFLGERKTLSIFIRGVLISSLYFFTAYYFKILNEKQEHQIEIEQLRQAQLEANLASLKEQLSPHFLFNTLNTLSSITQEKPVKDYVSEFANVYRYMLVHNKLDKATLQQEFDFIHSYLYIIKTRMGDAIEIKMNIDERLMQYHLPPLSLQLLIENAIKHNIASVNKPLHVNIYSQTNHQLVVSNNFQPKITTHHSTGIGLSNLSERYRLLFAKEIEIEKSTTEFCVTLPLIQTNESTDN